VTYLSCSPFLSISIPKQQNLIWIGDDAFYFCKSLETIPHNISRIGNRTFALCSSLESLVIPEGVVRIGYLAFACCSSLKSVYIPASVTHISGEAFNSTALVSIRVHPDNPVYDSRDNCNAIIETATNKLVATCKSTVVPDGVSM
jgi:hypothetical protein